MELINKNTVIPIIVTSIMLFIATIIFIPLDLVVKLIAVPIALVLIFAKPLWGIFLCIAAIPFIPNESLLGLLFMILISFIIHRVLYKEEKFISTPLDMSILAFLFVQILTTLTSSALIPSMQNLLVSVLSIGLYMVIIHTIKTKQQLTQAIKLFIFVAFGISCLGIIQYFTMGSTNKVWVDVATNPDLTTRVVGTFGNPNILAEYLEHILPVSLALVFASRKKLHKGISAVLFIVITACFIATFSRGAWLGFAAAMMLFIFLTFAEYIPLLIVGGIAALPLMPNVVLQRISTIGSLQDTSNVYRLYLWEGTINMIRDFWITGVGFGYWAFRYAFLEYALGGRIAWHSHNLYLELLAEMGIWGFITFLWLIFTLFKTTFHLIRTTKDTYIRYIAAGLLCGMLSILVHGISEHILYLTKSVLMFWMFLGFLMVAKKIGQNDMLEE